MSQLTNINISMSQDVKERADILFQSLGFTLTTAINMFVLQSIREQAIPFQPKLKRKSLSAYLEEYHGTSIESVLHEAENNDDCPIEIDWGAPVGDEIW